MTTTTHRLERTPIEGHLPWCRTVHDLDGRLEDRACIGGDLVVPLSIEDEGDGISDLEPQDCHLRIAPRQHPRSGDGRVVLAFGERFGAELTFAEATEAARALITTAAQLTLDDAEEEAADEDPSTGSTDAEAAVHRLLDALGADPALKARIDEIDDAISELVTAAENAAVIRHGRQVLAAIKGRGFNGKDAPTYGEGSEADRNLEHLRLLVDLQGRIKLLEETVRGLVGLQVQSLDVIERSTRLADGPYRREEVPS